MDIPSDEKYITITQAAEFLRVSENTIHRWIRQGVIPVYKIENVYNFKSDELEAWARYKNLGVSGKIGNRSPRISRVMDDETINLRDALKQGGIHYKLGGNTPEEVLKNLVENILYDQVPEQFDQTEKSSLLLSSLLEREKLASTGLGAGIAIPHPRKPSDWGLDQPLCAIVFLEHDVDFHSVDDEPVHVLFVILCSTVKGHLRLLSQVSHMIHTREMQDFLRSRPDEKSLMDRVDAFFDEVKK